MRFFILISCLFISSALFGMEGKFIPGPHTYHTVVDTDYTVTEEGDEISMQVFPESEGLLASEKSECCKESLVNCCDKKEIKGICCKDEGQSCCCDKREMEGIVCCGGATCMAAGSAGIVGGAACCGNPLVVFTSIGLAIAGGTVMTAPVLVKQCLKWFKEIQ